MNNDKKDQKIGLSVGELAITHTRRDPLFKTYNGKPLDILVNFGLCKLK